MESFFDGLNDLLGSSLPGKTFRSWVERADYRPDDGPLITYEALLEVIHIHLVDMYAASKHPTAPGTRLEMWQESAAQFPPCIPATPDELLVLLSKRADRTLSPRGIELGGMFYTSDELMALRCELASHNVDADRVAVRYNPWDLGEVWVLNPIDNAYLRASAVDPAMKGMTEYPWRVLKRAIRDRFDQPDHLLNLAAGRNAIRDVVEAAMQKPSRQRRVRAARFLQPPPSLTGEPNESGAGNAEATSPAESAAHDAQPGVPAAPDTIEDTGVHHSDPSEVNVDDWEVASPDL